MTIDPLAFRHVWVGRHIKAKHQSLELALLPDSENEGGEDARVLLGKLLVSEFRGEPSSCWTVAGETIDSGTRMFKIPDLAEGSYRTAIVVGEDLVELPEIVTVLPEQTLRRLLAGEFETQTGIGPSRLLNASSAQRLARQIVGDALPFVSEEEVVCQRNRYIPDELLHWTLSSLVDDLVSLEAFRLAEIRIHIGVVGNEEERGRRPFSALRQNIEINMWAAVKDPPSDNAERFFGDEQYGFGAKLRLDGQLETDLVHSLQGKEFNCRVRVRAPRARFALVDVSELLHAVAELHQPAAKERRQRIAIDIAAGLRFEGDRELLAQMLANLVENAVRHAPEEAALSVTAAAGADGIDVVIADDGPGIPLGERESVSRPFYRARRTGLGSGLDLSLVREIAGLHGIGMDLADNRPGLRVCLRLPQPAAPGSAVG